jgi:subtilase family serine protease
MKVPSLVACAAVLCALTTAGFSQTSGSHTISRPQVVGAADPSASTHFSVYLPLTNQAALEQLISDQANSASPSYHKWLTPAQFKAQFGPKPSDMAEVVRKLQSAGFHITAEHTQNIEVEGSVAAVENLFSTRLQQVKMAKGDMKFAAANHRLTLPVELASAGAVIPEYAPHLSAHVHSEHLHTSGTGVSFVGGGGKINQRLGSADSFFYATDMNEAYVFPSFTTSVVPVGGAAPAQITGAGATIGIVISSVISPTDIALSFKSTVSAGSASDVQNFGGNTTVPVPTVTIDPVVGGSGAFNPASDDASEASLDTQMSLDTAPGAKEILYNIPDLTDASIAAAYTQVDEENRVDVVSSSFGECELDFTAAANGGVDFTGILQTFHSLFAQGNAQGITFVASSGDNGAVACTSTVFATNPSNSTNFVLGVENPASDPSVTAVGGTSLQVSATPTANDNFYVSENANFDPRVPASFTVGSDTFTVGNNTWGSGGGYSIVFAKPSYQSLVNTGSTTQRAVPDVSLMMGGCPGDADLTAQDCTVLPRSAAIVWIGGVPNLLIGTSSSSPQMAGVLALDIELQGSRLGNINPQIYKLSALQTSASAKTASLSQFFHRSITGNNNGFTVSPGQAYSTVLGNGTLIVKNFLQLSGAPAAGTPNTPSNP